jgi:hypothetical protein
MTLTPASGGEGGRSSDVVVQVSTTRDHEQVLIEGVAP